MLSMTPVVSAEAVLASVVVAISSVTLSVVEVDGSLAGGVSEPTALAIAPGAVVVLDTAAFFDDEGPLLPETPLASKDDAAASELEVGLSNVVATSPGISVVAVDGSITGGRSEVVAIIMLSLPAEAVVALEPDAFSYVGTDVVSCTWLALADGVGALSVIVELMNVVAISSVTLSVD